MNRRDTVDRSALGVKEATRNLLYKIEMCSTFRLIEYTMCLPAIRSYNMMPVRKSLYYYSYMLLFELCRDYMRHTHSLDSIV